MTHLCGPRRNMWSTWPLWAFLCLSGWLSISHFHQIIVFLLHNLCCFMDPRLCMQNFNPSTIFGELIFTFLNRNQRMVGFEIFLIRLLFIFLEKLKFHLLSSQVSTNDLVNVSSSCTFTTVSAIAPGTEISGLSGRNSMSGSSNLAIIESPNVLSRTSGTSTTLPLLSVVSPQTIPVLEPQPPANRRNTNSSQCCVLEWLLSDEADLCLLPPSFYETKTSLPSCGSTIPTVTTTTTVATITTAATTTMITSPIVTTVATANPAVIDTTLLADRILRDSSLSSCSGALTIQLPTAMPGTGAILVSPVTPMATTPVRAAVEQPGTPADRPIILTVDPSEQSAELALMTGHRSALSVCSSVSPCSSSACPTSTSSSSLSSVTSPIISSSPIQTHRPGSLLVVSLYGLINWWSSSHLYFIFGSW